MKNYISILRGINVGGHRKILMADLKKLYEGLGFTNITSYIQSGNLIFKSESGESNLEISNQIEQAIFDHYKFDVPVIVFTVEELENAIKLNPFIDGAEIEKLHLTFLKNVPDKERIEKLKDINYAPDEFEIIDKYIFLKCLGKYHETKLGTNLLENKLKVTATTRNWKTVMKLLELSESH